MRTQNRFVPLVSLLSVLAIFYYDHAIRSIKNYDGNNSSINTMEYTETTHNNEDGDEFIKYTPGSAEKMIMENLDTLGFNKVNNPRTCFVYDPNATYPTLQASLTSYREELEAHTKAIQSFETIPNLMHNIKHSSAGTEHDICNSLRPHPDGILGLFPSKQLSLSSSGYVEPILPPMRHPGLCGDPSKHLSMDFLVHDFEAMCHKLKPTSKLVLIDIGASLDFHGRNQPIMWLLNLYEKMGFHFDHIFGFEVTDKDPKKVYGGLPEKYFSSYHWINVGVSKDKGDKLNPLRSIVKAFDEDDFIVVKLDIDTSSIEVPLVHQLLEESDIFSKLIDHFYFEHHVHLGELNQNWGRTMVGTVKESFELFSRLREAGIPAHSWV